MDSSILAEVDRLRGIMSGFGFALPNALPATLDDITLLETETGIRFDQHLREFYQFSNGSLKARWLAVMTDELTPCEIRPIADCLSWWREWLPYDDGVHALFGPGESGRDPRIRPHYSVHRHWLPVAESNCWGTTVFFDADPSPLGNHGQIIVYQHDPDAVYYAASNFLEFFRRSNDFVTTHGRSILFCDGKPSRRLPFLA
jgi:cell wall assembly regulator SMI1